MLPATIWGFLTALLIVLVGAYFMFPESFDQYLHGRARSTTPMTLLCMGGSGALCCGEDHHEYTSGLAITVDCNKGVNVVNVFVEGEGSANGDIIECNDTHVSFGKKSCDGSAQTSPQASAQAPAQAPPQAPAQAPPQAPAQAPPQPPAPGTSTGAPAQAPPKSERCRTVNGEINRLTGIADIRIKDEKDKTVVQFNKIECRRQWGKF
jgi:hypothetical protein